ncbi:MAG: flagellar protein FlgN [Desulfobulbaceae bacterium]|nr:flagellar protein FlgN [Desulfobulbaceae bacterium]
MNSTSLRVRLLKLHALLLRERECCKAVDLPGLQEVLSEKELLLLELEPLEPASGSELRELAAQIKNENRRNAYLLWATLRFIRESMEFFGRQAGQPSYGAGGRMIQNGGSGLVLSGRI